MNLLTLDFETYFAPKYGLSLMPTLLYVRDPRFKVHGCAVKHDSNPAVWVTGSELEEYFATIDWDSTTVVAHNALFDGLVLAEQYGHHPAQWIDTAGLARAILPPNVPADLATLATVLRLGAKGKELKESKGVVDLPPNLEASIASYAVNDAELAYGIHALLYPYLPQNERDLLSLTIHWGTKPRLKLNRRLIKDALHAARAEREALIRASGYTATELRSAKQFPEIVRSLGIEPPTKLNDKGETAFALAANDLGFIELQARYPEHRALWAARIAANSNSTVNRLENFYNVTRQRSTIVMPLNYCGARHTMRWSGAGKLNMQNLERGSATRLAIEAQDEDEVIIVVDSSQIELRMNAWFCNQESSLEILRTGQDIYSHTATAHFGYPVTKKMPERQFGKALELALGYGMGTDKFQTQAAIGIMGTPPVQLTDEEAQNAVTKYRDGHNNIKGLWRWLNDTALPRMARKDQDEDPLVWKCVSFTHQTVHLPNGLALEYPNLEQDEEGNWWYEAEGRQKIYGAKLLENIIQALARIVVGEQILKIEAYLKGFAHTVSSTHDEALAVCHRNVADYVLRTMIRIFSTAPSWASDLPLAAEGGYARNYSK